MQTPVIITIGIPSHGWLPVTFKSDVINLELYASGVLNDPLEECYLGIKRLIAHKTAEITFWMEPHTYFFYFEPIGVKDFRLTISEAPHFDKERTAVAILEGSYKQLIAPMRRALLEFFDLDYDQAHWPVSFKRTDVEALPKGL